jgi:hypothetical protein
MKISPFHLVLVAGAVFCAQPASSAADSSNSDHSEQTVSYQQKLFASLDQLCAGAKEIRPDVWTAQIKNKLELCVVFERYEDMLDRVWLEQAAAGQGKLVGDWVKTLIQRYDKGDMADSAKTAMRDALEVRRQLVDFAGEATVAKMDGDVPRGPDDSVRARHLLQMRLLKEQLLQYQRDQQ